MNDDDGDQDIDTSDVTTAGRGHVFTMTSHVDGVPSDPALISHHGDMTLSRENQKIELQDAAESSCLDQSQCEMIFDPRHEDVTSPGFDAGVNMMSESRAEKFGNGSAESTHPGMLTTTAALDSETVGDEVRDEREKNGGTKADGVKEEGVTGGTAGRAEKKERLSCFLCMEALTDREELKKHLTQIHCVKLETLGNILALLDKPALDQVPVGSHSRLNGRLSTNESADFSSRGVPPDNNVPIAESESSTKKSDRRISEPVMDRRSSEFAHNLDAADGQSLGQSLGQSFDQSREKLVSKEIETETKFNSSAESDFLKVKLSAAAASSLALLGASGLQTLSSLRPSITGSSGGSGFIEKCVASVLDSYHLQSEVEQEKLRRMCDVGLAGKLDENSNQSNKVDAQLNHNHNHMANMSLKELESCESCYTQKSSAAQGESRNKTQKNVACDAGQVKVEDLRTSANLRSGKSDDPSHKSRQSRSSFRCELCLESFAELNGLLAHYRSEAHINKLQLQRLSFEPMKGHSRQFLPLSGSGLATPTTMPSYFQVKAMQAGESLLNAQGFPGIVPLSGVSNAAVSPSNSSSIDASAATTTRPFRCDICKVCYSLKQQLQTHFKSVQHQTRIAKLQQTPTSAAMATSVKSSVARNPATTFSSDMMVSSWLQMQNQLMSQAVSGLAGGLLSPSSIPFTQFSPMFSGMYPGSLEGFAPLASYPPHADVKKLLSSMNTRLPNEVATTSKVSSPQPTESYVDKSKPSEKVSSGASVDAGTSLRSTVSSTSTSRRHESSERINHLAMLKCLQNIGFECAMQFNEYRQKPVATTVAAESVSESAVSVSDSTADDATKLTGNMIPDTGESSNVSPVTTMTSSEENVKDKNVAADLPEVRKSTCLTCGKQFSSVWVLKSHEEEVHHSVLSSDVISAFAETLNAASNSKTETKPNAVSSSGSSTETTTRAIPLLAEPPIVKQERKQEAPPPPVSSIRPSEFDPGMFPFPQLTASQIAQMMSMPMPMLMNMGLLPPTAQLMPMMMPTPLPQDFFSISPQFSSGYDPSSAARVLQQQPPLPSSTMSMSSMSMSSMSSKSVHQSSLAQMSNPLKSARTRINEEQLVILRAHFDINNSPGEDQIREMSERTSLPPKVIKHWFRNTLFKERQRNKDSPYNFSIPPATTLNMEDYEKNGEVKMEAAENGLGGSGPGGSAPGGSAPGGNAALTVKVERLDVELRTDTDKSRNDSLAVSSKSNIAAASLSVSSQPGKSNSVSASNDQFMSIPSSSNFISNKTSDKVSMPRTTSRSDGIFLHAVSNLSSSLSLPEYSTSDRSVSANSSVNSLASTETGEVDRRTFRTRFNARQVEELQEVFARNSYPTDGELMNISEKINLSQRVVAIWFQNARQKNRRIQEKRLLEGKALDNSGSGEHDTSANTSFVLGSDESDGDDISGLSKSWPRTDAYRNRSKESHDSFPESAGKPRVDLKVSCAESSSGPVGNSKEATEKDFRKILDGIRPEQLRLLRDHFGTNPFPSSTDVDELSGAADLQKNVVQDWFKHARSRERKHHAPTNQPPLSNSGKLSLLTNLEEHVLNQNVRMSELWMAQLLAQPGSSIEHQGRAGHYRSKVRACPHCSISFYDKHSLKEHIAMRHSDKVANKTDSSRAAEQQGKLPGIGRSSSKPKLDAKLASTKYPYQLSAGAGLEIPTADQLQVNMQRLYAESFQKCIQEMSSSLGMGGSSGLGMGGNGVLGVGGSMFTKQPDASSSSMGGTRGIVTSAFTGFPSEDMPLDLSTSSRGVGQPSRSSAPGSLKQQQESLKRSSSSCSSGSSFPTHSKQQQQQQQQNLDDSLSEMYSESEMDSSYNGFTDSNGFRCGPPGSSLFGSKRYRTQMSDMQIQVMRTIFADSKMPTISECETLGQELSLPRRVVQVWFQNARAKEKKGCEVGGRRILSSCTPSPLPSSGDSCTLCGTVYTSQHTLQDHLFTRGHLGKVKASMMSQDFFASSFSPTRDLDVTSSASHFMRIDNSEMKDYSAYDSGIPASKRRRLNRNRSRTSAAAAASSAADTATTAILTAAASAASAATSSQQLLQQPNPFTPGGPLTDILGGLMPYMYQGGMGGFYLGQSDPFAAQNVLPGLLYDPTSFGIQLSMLQIPPGAIRQVEQKLKDKTCTLTHYTQDCMSFQDLKKSISADNWSVARRSNIDVGYICKKCSLVYPRRADCVRHQLLCYYGVGGELGAGGEQAGAILKLEQMQYECCACRVKCNTVEEYQKHCVNRKHAEMLASWIRSQASTHLHIPTVIPVPLCDAEAASKSMVDGDDDEKVHVVKVENPELKDGDSHIQDSHAEPLELNEVGECGAECVQDTEPAVMKESLMTGVPVTNLSPGVKADGLMEKSSCSLNEDDLSESPEVIEPRSPAVETIQSEVMDRPLNNSPDVSGNTILPSLPPTSTTSILLNSSISGQIVATSTLKQDMDASMPTCEKPEMITNDVVTSLARTDCDDSESVASPNPTLVLQDNDVNDAFLPLVEGKLCTGTDDDGVASVDAWEENKIQSNGPNCSTISSSAV